MEVAVRDCLDRNLRTAAAASFDGQVAGSRGVGDRGPQPYGLHGRESLRVANTMTVLGNPIADSDIFSGEEDDEQDESQQSDDEQDESQQVPDPVPTPKRVRVMAPRQVLVPKLLSFTTATPSSILLSFTTTII